MRFGGERGPSPFDETPHAGDPNRPDLTMIGGSVRTEPEVLRSPAGLGSGDGPLSVRVRPSHIKRDCDRRTTSMGRKCLVNVHAKSRLIPETSVGTSVRNQGAGGACPDRTRAIPCNVRAITTATRTRAPRCQAPNASGSHAGSHGNVAAIKTTPSAAAERIKPRRRRPADTSLPSQDASLHPAEERSIQKSGQCRRARTAGSGCRQPAGESSSAAYRTADIASSIKHSASLCVVGAAT
jgi:hypothetical protein